MLLIIKPIFVKTGVSREKVMDRQLKLKALNEIYMYQICLKNVIYSSQLFLLLVVMASCSLRRTSGEDVLVPVEMCMTLGDRESDLHQFLFREQERLRDMGWSYEKGQLVRIMQVPNTLIQKEGKEESAQRMFIQIGSGRLFLELDGDIYSLNMEDFFKSMDGCCNQKNPSATKSMSEPTDVPRCKDYNGPLGNGQNDQGKVQSLINFIGSDCDLAMGKGLCWDEHNNDMGGCYNTHGGVICTDLL